MDVAEEKVSTITQTGRWWPKKTIVYYNPWAPEDWGPESINGGIGGSEEAVVYLSRELAKLGWDATVYCQRQAECTDNVKGADHPIKYKPYGEMNKLDLFDVFIGGRIPEYAHNVKARLKLVDLHDHKPEELLFPVVNEVDKFIVKSQWHRGLYPNIPDEKFAIIGNGIVKEQFKGNPVKRKHSVGYFSLYDRGLNTLLDLWSALRKRVPDATLDIYYGWGVFDSVYSGQPTMVRLKNEILRKLHNLRNLGVTEHGRVSHVELAKAMKDISVWLYPTEWPETYCITAVKTAESEMHQVCTKVAALPETAPHATFIDCQSIYSCAKHQKAFVDAAVEAIKRPIPSAPPENRYWGDVAKQWEDVMNSKSDTPDKRVA